MVDLASRRPGLYPVNRDAAHGCRSAALRRLADSIDARMRDLLPPPMPSHRLDVAIRHALLGPGKRLRPMLALLVARTLGLDDAAVMDAACALEMLHTASLILDDLPCMDDADLRRGRPASHVAHGEDVAILAAVSLISRAFGVVAGASAIPAAVRAEMGKVLADACGQCGLSAGQVGDLHGEGGARSVNDLERINHLKTGMLFQAAVDIALAAATVGTATAGTAARANLRRFAHVFGIAFQLLDDLRDAPPDARDAGEDVGKVTLVALMGRDAAAQRTLQDRQAMADCIGAAGIATTELLDFVDAIFGAPDRPIPQCLAAPADA